MIVEHSYAVLVRDIPEQGLAKGDVGVVVHIYGGNGQGAAAYELELFTIDGQSLDTVTVPADAVRAATSADRMTTRAVAAE
jgi:hypothetical protein